MNSDCIGKTVSLDCGGLGFFQGVINSIQLQDQTITITNAYQNGVPCKTKTVTISAPDIEDLNIVEDSSASKESNVSVPEHGRKQKVADSSRLQTGSPGVSTVAVKRKPRTQVAESLAKSAASGGSPKPGGVRNSPKVPSKNKDHQQNVQQQSYALAAAGHRGSPRKGIVERRDSTSAGGGHRTPNRQGRANRGLSESGGLGRRDNDCFGSGIEDFQINEEFDFEKNLALFDKRLVFEEIDHGNSNQPDVVRLVDCNTRNRNATPVQDYSYVPQSEGGRNKTEPKYRNDENVLETLPAQYRQISVDVHNTPPKVTASATSKKSPNVRKKSESATSHYGEYSTDSGLIVPALSSNLRNRLFAAAEANGISRDRLVELVARSTSEITIQLLGGSHRLNPLNSHQVPTVVALCGPGKSGAYGLAALRHLASQGVRTCAYLPSLPFYPPHIDSELALYKLCLKKNFNTLCLDVKDLPSTSVDVILLALDDHEMLQQERTKPWHRAGIAWARSPGSGAAPPVMIAIDPLSPHQGYKAELSIKASVLPGLPIWYGSWEANDNGGGVGKLYMVNLAIPSKVYKDVGIGYSSPFGAKTFITLHGSEPPTMES